MRGTVARGRAQLLYLGQLCLLFSLGVHTPRLFAATGPSPVVKLKKSKEQYRDEYFRFVTDVLRWAARAQLILAPGEDREEIAFKFSGADYDALAETFEAHRELLAALGKQGDLNQVNGQEVLPRELSFFIKQQFALASPNEPMQKSHLLLKLVGGEFNFADGHGEHVTGLLDKVDAFDLASWAPVQAFINQFKDTLTLDSHLASQLGRVLLPLIKHYYQAMDTVSRLRLFKELADDYAALDLNGQAKHDREQLAVKIFQSSGPVLIKFLQQLQEETRGETPISRVLEGLKHSKPMPGQRAQTQALAELRRHIGGVRLRHFSFEQRPLGIASIAQTHLFHYQGKPYIIKILKDKVKDVFAREKAMLTAILADEKNEGVFDKGLKQSIANMIAGIAEEVDFNFERRNLVQGGLSYPNPEHGLATVELPAFLAGMPLAKPGVQPPSEALIMTLAPGEPLGELMKRAQSHELTVAYSLVQNLYADYLRHALHGTEAVHFYHGDLHRENIFIDLQARQARGLLTLIDFGNAGELSPGLQQSMTEILRQTKKTSLASQERARDEAIMSLGKVLRSFIVEENGLDKRKASDAVGLLDSFFSACFNPVASLDEHLRVNKQVNERKAELICRKKSLQADLARVNAEGQDALLARITQTQDDIDFANALLGNCLNSVVSPLLTALASPQTVSDKLAIVFQELQKNGIPLPRELIFFNKSKALLEGILTNLAQKLDEAEATYRYVEPEALFERVLAESKNKAGGGLRKTMDRFLQTWSRRMPQDER